MINKSAVPSVQGTKDTATKFVVQNADIVIPGQSTAVTGKSSRYGSIRWRKVEKFVEELEKRVDQKTDGEDKKCSSFQKEVIFFIRFKSCSFQTAIYFCLLWYASYYFVRFSIKSWAPSE